ncbi:long-chain-fatty-acid-CoA ligase 1 [Pelomyxa schiedti]|nr:long-chain-fatty-acid-CoA ligase 1 [Pelomyxa schiedti]
MGSTVSSHNGARGCMCDSEEEVEGAGPAPRPNCGRGGFWRVVLVVVVVVNLIVAALAGVGSSASSCIFTTTGLGTPSATTGTGPRTRGKWGRRWGRRRSLLSQPTAVVGAGGDSSSVWLLPRTSTCAPRCRKTLLADCGLLAPLCPPILGPGKFKTLYEIFWTSVSEVPDKPLFGSRKVLGTKIREDKLTLYELSPYEWISSRQAGAIVDTLSAALQNVGVTSALPFSSCTATFEFPEASQIVGFWCDTCVEWMLMFNAVVAVKATAATIYTNLGVPGAAHIIAETAMEVLFIGTELLESFVELLNSRTYTFHLRIIIYRGKTPTAHILSRLTESSLNVYSFDEFLKLGESKPRKHNPPGPDDIAVIIYTSGTTGSPKGVMLTHKNVIGAIVSCVHVVGIGDTLIAYLPLAHIYELAAEFLAISQHTKIGYANPRTLTDASVYNCRGDFSELQPTFFASVPSVCDKIVKGILSKANQSSLPIRILFHIALKLKLVFVGRLRGTLIGRAAISMLDKLVFHKLQLAFGGKLQLVVIGGAALSRYTHKLLICFLSCPVIFGYGSSESSGTISCTYPDDYSFGKVGPPVCPSEVKLVDVPELNYTHKSKPLPCGEICVRGPNISTGYYKLPKMTAETFDEDGWLHTGDVGRWHKNGTLEIIDRIRNIVKMAHGEYIALEKIEGALGTSPFVDQICIYAHPLKLHPFAIIVANKSNIEALLGKKFGPDMQSFLEACREPNTKEAILNSLEESAVSAKLTRIERVSYLCIVGDQWTAENGMLTASLKLKRAEIYSRYAAEIKAMMKK